MRNWFLASDFVHSSCQASVIDGFWLGRLDHTGCRDVNRALGIGVDSDLRGSSPYWLLPPRDGCEVEQYCSTLTAKVVV